MIKDSSESANTSPEIILASGSPRRRQILEFLQIPHRVMPADVDERALQATLPREFALKAALLKATALDDVLPKGTIVVAADTIVVKDKQIYMKPLDPGDAVRMLAELAGQTHQVITGLAVRETGRATQLDAATTDVTLRALQKEDIEEYVATGDPLDKAGSYGIQSLGGSLVQQISGDFFNVVGLPVDKLLKMLEVHMDVTAFRDRRRILTPALFRTKSV